MVSKDQRPSNEAPLAAGTAALKTHPDEDDPRDDLIQRFKAKIGELTMENELLYEKARRVSLARASLASR